MAVYAPPDDNPRALLREVCRDTSILVQMSRGITADTHTSRTTLEEVLEKVSIICFSIFGRPIDKIDARTKLKKKLVYS